LSEFEGEDADTDVTSTQIAERVAAAEARATRAEVAASKGVPVELLAGTEPNREALEAHADAVLEYLSQRPALRLHVPSEGNNPSYRDNMSELHQFARELFEGGDW